MIQIEKLVFGPRNLGMPSAFDAFFLFVYFVLCFVLFAFLFPRPSLPFKFLGPFGFTDLVQIFVAVTVSRGAAGGSYFKGFQKLNHS